MGSNQVTKSKSEEMLTHYDFNGGTRGKNAKRYREGVSVHLLGESEHTNPKTKTLNRSLHNAKATKQDEFYTQLSDIEKELKHYQKHFKNKTILCNCDDPRVSNFFKYFINNFEKLALKKVIATCYKNDKPDLFSQNKSANGIYLEYNGEQEKQRLPDPTKIKPRELKSDGDFRSEECVNLLKQADIVVTNPPFSLFREYLAQLIEHNKKFVIIGNLNAITYTDVFRLIKANKIWLGNGFEGGNAYFKTSSSREYASGVYDPGTGLVKFRNVAWFTNLDIAKRHQELILFSPYSAKQYPAYDNYDAIEVGKTKDIPKDFDGVMGVPISFLDKYNPEQFEIRGWARGTDEFDARPTKRYENPIQIKPDGTRSGGGKVNTGPTLLLKKKPSETYYIAENADGYLEQLYMRILIKRK